MVQASTTAVFTADKVWAGTVVATGMVAKVAVLIAIVAAINSRGEGLNLRGAEFKLTGVDAAEPDQSS